MARKKSHQNCQESSHLPFFGKAFCWESDKVRKMGWAPDQRILWKTWKCWNEFFSKFEFSNLWKANNRDAEVGGLPQTCRIPTKDCGETFLLSLQVMHSFYSWCDKGVMSLKVTSNSKNDQCVHSTFKVCKGHSNAKWYVRSNENKKSQHEEWLKSLCNYGLTLILVIVSWLFLAGNSLFEHPTDGFSQFKIQFRNGYKFFNRL